MNIKSYYGIYAGTDNLCIYLLGNNTIIGQSGSNIYSFGIYAKELDIFQNGGGKLNVSGGTGSSSYGIYSSGNITIIDGTVTATSTHDGNASCAIYSGGVITIKDGVVNATGFDKGISGAVTVKRGTVTTQSDTNALNGSLTTSDGCIVTASTKKDGSEVVAYNAANHATYKYIKIDPSPVAIGSTGYPTLQSAVDAVTDGQTIKLLDNIGLSATITIASDKANSFILDLNSKELINYNGQSIDHYGTGTLTITDNGDDKKGVIQAPSETIKVTSGNLIVAGGTVKCTTSSGAAISNTGTLTISGGTVECMAKDGVAISNTGTLTISGGKVERMASNGVAISNTGTLTISGGTVGVHRYYNYGVAISNTGTLTISGGTVECMVEDGVAINNTGTLTISGGSVERNRVAISNSSTGTITVLSGSPVIKGKGMAMDTAPTLSEGMQVMGSEDYDGSSLVDYDSANINNYKYLVFGYLAQIGTTGYLTLQEAVDAVTEGKTIKLLNNMTLSTYVTIPDDNTISFILDLNNKTLASDDEKSIYHNGTGTLTITDNSDDKNGKISCVKQTTIKVTSGKLIVAGGTVECTDFGMAIVNYGTLAISDGTVEYTGSSNGRAIDNYGTLAISGGTVKCTGNGTAIVNSGTLTISGGTVECPGSNGTAIANYGTGTITVLSGSPVIKGTGMAMDTAPTLGTGMQVMGSVDYDGSTLVAYDSAKIKNYKYLKFTAPSYNGGSGSDSGSSSNDNSNPVIVTPPALDKPNSPTQGEIKVPGTVDDKGNVTVNITDKTVVEAFEKALADAKKNGTEQNGITVVLRVNTGNKTCSNVIINLPKAVQDTIIAKKIVSIIVVVDNPEIRVGMDLATIKEINKQAKSDVNITATRMDSGKLTGNAKKAIGSRPVFDLKVNYGNGKTVKSFGEGCVSITIPYTLGANEKAGNVQAVYVDSKGKVHWLVNSVYDSSEKVLRFSTDHFSTYGIGYKQVNTAFKDITGHWAKEDIEFAVSRGLFSDTSTTIFRPNTPMTRGMFVTALGRLANADVSGYAKSSFSDVKGDAYYMGYIEWASENNILDGFGNGKFAPDQSITHEQMAVIMSNYAKTIGYTLPKVHIEKIFADNAKISTYAKEALKQMQMAGVFKGKNDNLNPLGTATRAEASAVLRRFVKLTISSDTAHGWSSNDMGK